MENQTQSNAEIELLSFRLAEQEYSVDIMSVREIRGWTRATPLPHAPAYVRGVINLRGTVLPVVDLSTRLGMAPVEGDARNVIIVVQVGSQTAGLLVDAVSDILALPFPQDADLYSFTTAILHYARTVALANLARHPEARAVYGETDRLSMLQIFEYTDCDLFACVC